MLTPRSHGRERQWSHIHTTVFLIAVQHLSQFCLTLPYYFFFFSLNGPNLLFLQTPSLFLLVPGLLFHILITPYFLLFKNNFIYLFLAVTWSWWLHRLFSSCGERGLLPSWWGAGFSLRWLLLLRSTGSRVHGYRESWSVALKHRLSSCDTGLVAPWHMGSSQVRDRTRVSCFDRRILYHWAIRKAPLLSSVHFSFFPSPASALLPQSVSSHLSLVLLSCLLSWFHPCLLLGIGCPCWLRMRGLTPLLTIQSCLSLAPTRFCVGFPLYF